MDFDECSAEYKTSGTHGPSFAQCPKGRTSHPDVRHPHCAPGIAAAVFSWIRRNRWQSHRGSGKAVDIRESGKGWRHRAWCSGSSAARVEMKPQGQPAYSRATGQALALPDYAQCPSHSTLTLRSPPSLFTLPFAYAISWPQPYL